MSRRLNRTYQSSSDGVDMTPMLDIVFILLIFFIVTAVFLDERGVDFTQAQGDAPPGPATSVIHIVVDAQDRIAVQGRVVSLDFVESEVQRHLASRPDASIDLRAAETARLQNIVTIKDDMEQAGRAVRFETFTTPVATAQIF